MKRLLVLMGFICLPVFCYAQDTCYAYFDSERCLVSSNKDIKVQVDSGIMGNFWRFIVSDNQGKSLRFWQIRIVDTLAKSSVKLDEYIGVDSDGVFDFCRATWLKFDDDNLFWKSKGGVYHSGNKFYQEVCGDCNMAEGAILTVHGVKR